MPNLYELMDEYDALQRALEDPDADREAILDALDEAKGDLKRKVDGVCRVLANLKGDAKKFRSEEERLGKRRKTLENDVARLESWVRDTMRLLDVAKVKTDTFSVTVSDGQPVVAVISEGEIPEEYFRVKRDVDRQAVMQAYKQHGEIVRGCDIIPGKPVLRIR
jgi:predicted nuclease with TOPRIM domain